MEILLTNDDGYMSSGFYPLLKELSKNYKVTAVPPDSEKSWIGKSITAHSPLKIKKTKLNDTPIYTVNGTPADCAQLGMYHILKSKPKLLVSGINIGENIGHARILSSGTIGAAMEASIGGVMAVASALHIPPEKTNINFHSKKAQSVFLNAAQITSKCVQIFCSKKLPLHTDLISINIPYTATPDSEFRITKPFREEYGGLFNKKNGKYHHNRPLVKFKNMKNGTDLKALKNNHISITPLSLELASKKSFSSLNNLLKKSW